MLVLSVKDVTRWRKRDRDRAARVAHNADTTSWRRGIAEVDFNPDDQAELLRHIRSGATVAQAAARLGMTFQAVYGRARWDVSFGQALEDLLAATCPAGDWCGRPKGVKLGGHCSGCRASHHPPTKPRVS
jgi:hypothetical protein